LRNTDSFFSLFLFIFFFISFLFFSGRKCFETLTVVASKSSEMNISWPGATDEDAWLEAPIPEQYQHHIVNGKVTCDVSDLYTH